MQHDDTSHAATLAWRGVTVDVLDHSKRTRRILDNQTGVVLPGQMISVMGPSGSGKSTLLAALSGRLNSFKSIQGEVTVNGHYANLSYGKAGFVPQEDDMLGTLTVRESLMYAARMRNPASMPKEEIKLLVNKILAELGLEECADTYVGNWHLRGISGGQKRRVSIGIELVTNPKILFLDEPTSGLDAAAAFYVMGAIRRLCHMGMSVVTTIHQPSSEVFDMFDKMALLSAGKLVYFGDAKKTATMFAEAGFPVPTNANPSDFFLLTINRDFGAVQDKIRAESNMLASLMDAEANVAGTSTLTTLTNGAASVYMQQSSSIDDNINRLIATYERSSDYQLLHAQIESLMRNPTEKFHGSRAPHANARAAVVDGMSTSMVLTERTVVNMMRNVGMYWLRLGMYIMLTICMGSIYNNLSASWPDVQNRTAILFFTTAFLSFMAIAGVPAFIEDAKIAQRERLAGQYSVAAFTFANTVTALPFIFLIAILSSICVYFWAKLRMTAPNFFRFVCDLFLALAATESFFMFLVAVIPNFLMVMAAGAGAMGLWMLVCGFFIPAGELPRPVWLYPVHYTALHTYSFEAFMRNEFQTEGGKTRYFDCPCSVQPGGCGPSNADCKISGDDILGIFSVSNRSYAFSMGMLTVMVAGWRILFYIMLKVKEKKSKGAQFNRPRVSTAA